MLKRCKRCCEEKELSLFGPQKKSPFIRSVCNPCRREQWKEYKNRNPERVREITRKAFSKYFERNRDLVRHRIRECVKKRYKLNPLPTIARSAARYAKKKKALPEWRNDFFIQEIYDLARRRSQTTGIKWCVDHIVPLQGATVCGLHCEANLRVIPASINLSKGNRHWPDMPC